MVGSLGKKLLKPIITGYRAVYKARFIEDARKTCQIPLGSSLAAIIGDDNYRDLYARARGQVWRYMQELPAGFTADDLVAVYLYTHQALTTYHYKSINDVLRGKWHAKEAELLTIAGILTAALLKLPAHPSECHRLTFLDAASLAGHVPGAVIPYPAFTSSGLKKWAAKPDQVRIVIFGKTGRYIANFSRFPHEREVLYLPGTEFKVLAREFEWDDKLKTDVPVIVLEEMQRITT